MSTNIRQHTTRRKNAVWNSAYYVTDEQRSQAGCIGVQIGALISVGLPQSSTGVDVWSVIPRSRANARRQANGRPRCTRT